MAKASYFSWILTIILGALTFAAGWSFVQIILYYVRKLTDYIGVTSEPLQYTIVILVMVLLVVIIGFAFRKPVGGLLKKVFRV